jgi:putative flippase GtrA
MVVKLFKNTFYNVKFLKYLVVGFTTAGIDFGIFVLLNKYIGLTPIISNMTSSLFALLFNFLASNHWTFEHRGIPQPRRVTLYLLWIVFNYFLGNALLAFLTLQLSLEAIISKVLLMAIITTYNFFVYKYVIFRDIKK